jgi:hypothetical protein
MALMQALWSAGKHLCWILIHGIPDAHHRYVLPKGPALLALIAAELLQQATALAHTRLKARKRVL